MNSADFRNALASWTRLQPQIDAVLKAAQDAASLLEDAEQKIDLAQCQVAVFQQREQEAREKTEAVQKLCADAEAKVTQAEEATRQAAEVARQLEEAQARLDRTILEERAVKERANRITETIAQAARG